MQGICQCTLLGKNGKITHMSKPLEIYRFNNYERGVAPFLTAYYPDVEWTTGVLIFPGGAYNHIGGDCQGDVLPEWFASRGMAAFVLNYRVAPHVYPAPQEDARWALAWIRDGNTTKHIGVLGFSAGGHLAASISLGYNENPAFAVLAYPVITMGGESGESEAYVHQRSRDSLLGSLWLSGDQDEMSLELRVTPEASPTFLFHMTEDAKVPVENSILYYQALRGAGVPAEMHLYHGPGHGRDVSCWSVWLSALEQWMIRSGFYHPSRLKVASEG